MVQKILTHLRAFVPNDQPDYPMLRKYSKEYPKYVSTLMRAKANIAILDYFKKIIHIQPEQRNAFIKSFIDELIAAANAQEKAVYDEIEYNETIIRMEGDVDKAKEIFGQKKVHDEKEMNLVYEMIEWVYGADKDDVNGQSRLNMFTLTKDLQFDAVIQRAETYRAIDRRHAEVAFGDYATTVDFKNKQDEKTKAENFYREKRDNYLATIKDWKAFVGFGIAAAAAIASFFVSWGLLVVSAIGIGYGVITLLSNKSNRKHAEAEFQQNCRLSAQLLTELFQEHAAYEAEFNSYDAYMDEILREIESV